MSATFVHLHLHTEYSLSDGLVRIKPLLSKVARLGMPAVAITDLHNLFAVVKFYKAALAVGVKPVIGMEVQLASELAGDAVDRLVLLARDSSGYRTLSRLSTRGYREGQHRGVVRLQRNWLEEDSEGLIALSGGTSGDIGQLLLAGKADEAHDRLSYWKAVYPDGFYLEIQRTSRAGEDAYEEEMLALAVATDTPLVATNDVRFLEREDFEVHEARVCIQQGYTLDDPTRARRYSDEQYLRTAAEMEARFVDLPEALVNSVEIAKRCNLQLNLNDNYLPDFPVPEGMTLNELLRREAALGLQERWQEITGTAAERTASTDLAAYRERLAVELDVICQMGFAGYFLIVADFIRWAKREDIPVGPGRGSGAGSLVAYSLGITDIDPIGYDLLFERFLNPERVSMPDFDIDFCMEKRDRVIDYVADKYGREQVSQIATHGTMAAKAVVRDVGRIMGYPYGFVDRLAKMIPFEIGMTLDKALEQEQELAEAYRRDDEIRQLIDMGRALEGLARSVGKHAGGVVISPSALTDFTPLYCEEGATALVSQLDKDDVEAIGLVKFDFLGLRTLTIIDWAVQTLHGQAHQTGAERLDIARIRLDDRATFELLKSQRTTAVFQLESRGMKELIKRLLPDCFDDIVALVALFRPGPLQSGMVDDFIDRKHGRAAVVYQHAELEPILKPTYGVILYQEQVMQIAQVLAGYTLGGADLLRRAMGKKKPEEMDRQRSVFVNGAEAHGVAPRVANDIFDLMEKFAGYGFNKSHSAAYALVSYQTAWLKTHHPAAFMAAVLSADMDSTDKVVVLIDECRNMDLQVVPPSINESHYRFTVGAQGQVVYGLGAVKGVGEAAIEAVLEARDHKQEFSDLWDLCQRLDLRRVTRRTIEALIRAGACDGLDNRRASLIANLPEALRYAEQRQRNKASGQTDLFGLSCASDTEPVKTPSEVRIVDDWDEAERLRGEKETLGLYLTGHPITRHLNELRHYTTGRLAAVLTTGDLDVAGFGGRARDKRVVVAGLVVDLRTRVSQRGDKIAFLTLDDRSARVEVRVFAEAFERYAPLIAEDRILVLDALLSHDAFTDNLRISAERIFDIEQARGEYCRRLVLDLTETDLAAGLGEDLAGVLEPFRSGRCPVVIDYTTTAARAELLLDESWRVMPVDDLLARLGDLVGATRVHVQY